VVGGDVLDFAGERSVLGKPGEEWSLLAPVVEIVVSA
jgi:hypothetical protein